MKIGFVGSSEHKKMTMKRREEDEITELQIGILGTKEVRRINKYLAEGPNLRIP